jgi:hypothetical protein
MKNNVLAPSGMADLGPRPWKRRPISSPLTSSHWAPSEQELSSSYLAILPMSGLIAIPCQAIWLYGDGVRAGSVSVTARGRGGSAWHGDDRHCDRWGWVLRKGACAACEWLACCVWGSSLGPCLVFVWHGGASFRWVRWLHQMSRRGPASSEVLYRAR